MHHDPGHDCSHLKEALADYLDGDLDTDLCRELHAHLKDCHPCRVVVDSTRQTIRFFSQERPVQLPPEVQRRLQETLKARVLPPDES